jgi:putative ABC transport system permease protein
VSQMMNSLNYIILVVILAAAALAFIVLYNLTNINITERIREIATIKVLGFFKNETASYVFRENRVLTAIGIIVGLGLGVLLHSFVMSQIKVDMVSFDVYISPLSYIYSIILTFVFNFGVNIIMSRKLENINMAESLKSVD